MKLTLLFLGIAFVALTFGACQHRSRCGEKILIAEPVACYPPVQGRCEITK